MDCRADSPNIANTSFNVNIPANFFPRISAVSVISANISSKTCEVQVIANEQNVRCYCQGEGRYLYGQLLYFTD